MRIIKIRDNRIRADETGQHGIIQPGSIVVQTIFKVKLLIRKFVFYRFADGIGQPDGAERHVLVKLGRAVSVFIRDHVGAAQVVLVEIVDAGGVDFGDSLAGSEDVFDVLPGPP